MDDCLRDFEKIINIFRGLKEILVQADNLDKLMDELDKKIQNNQKQLS